MMSIGEISRIAGVSIRTLRYYDERGLLVPTNISNSGYRLYDDNALLKLEQILFYKELDFSLEEIEKILSEPGYDRQEALNKQKHLLTLKKQHLENLICSIEQIENGEIEMSLKEFDNSNEKNAKDEYAAEARARWGNTDAYAQSVEKGKKYTDEDREKIAEQADEIIKEFAACIDLSPSSPQAQNLVSRWQSHITKYYYDCKKEILSCLSDMYVADNRFTANLDRFADGTAQFMHDAIKEYCK